MEPELFATPEAAAMSGFPAAHCRVVASAADGDAAFVVLDTGPGEYRDLYGGTAERVAGGWYDGSSGNGPAAGWTALGDANSGVAYVYGEVPAGADRVRAALGGDVREAPIQDGVYLVAWWGVPAEVQVTPELVAFRVAGTWDAAGPVP